MSFLDQSDNRLTGLTCEDAIRILTAAAGGILRGELHFTSDSLRAFYENHIIAPVVHGADLPIADEAAMLALNSSESRKCYRADWCIRADTPDGIWLCIAGRGTSIAQWRFLGHASGLIISGGDFDSGSEDLLSGGDFLGEPAGLTDGGRFHSYDTLTGGTFT